jgi:hypothetical protein
LATLFAALLLVPGVSHADDAMRQGLERLRAEDLRVATVGYRLTTRGLPICARTRPQAGLLVHDIAQYAPAFRADAEALFALGHGPAVEAVVAGGPADRAGVRAGDRLVAINGAPVIAAISAKARYDSVAAVQKRLREGFGSGAVTLALDRGGQPLQITVTGAPACASDVQLIPGTDHNSSADGTYAIMVSALVEEAQNDSELAFLIGHEMAHNILGHPARLESEGVSFGLFSGIGRNAARIRATEQDADYFGLYLAAQAGYDPADALNFWRRYTAKHSSFLADATHLNGGNRIRFLERVAAEIAAQRQAGSPLKPDLARVQGLADQARGRSVQGTSGNSQKP